MTIPSNGIFPAFLSPLDTRGQLAVPVAEALLQHLLKKGVDGVYIAGSTGEGMRLPLAVRKQLLETLMPLMGGKTMMVHVGANSLQETLQLAEHAAEQGADAISSLPPAARTPAQVTAFYQELATRSPLPLLLYYFPKVAPLAFPTDDALLDICRMPNVLGVKFTDYNLYLLQRLRNSGVMVFNGYDEMLAAGLLMGASGGIGSTYSMMPEVYLKIRDAAVAGDWETARRWQRRANAVIEVLMRFPFFAAVRSSVAHMGFDCGPMMSGEALDSTAQREELLTLLDDAMQGETQALVGWPGTAFATGAQ